MTDAAGINLELKRKTGTCARLCKDYEYYRREVGTLQKRREALFEADPESWETKNAGKLVDEANRMIEDAATRLSDALAKLGDVIANVKDQPGIEKELAAAVEQHGAITSKFRYA